MANPNRTTEPIEGLAWEDELELRKYQRELKWAEDYFTKNPITEPLCSSHIEFLRFLVVERYDLFLLHQNIVDRFLRGDYAEDLMDKMRRPPSRCLCLLFLPALMRVAGGLDNPCHSSRRPFFSPPLALP